MLIYALSHPVNLLSVHIHGYESLSCDHTYTKLWRLAVLFLKFSLPLVSPFPHLPQVGVTHYMLTRSALGPHLVHLSVIPSGHAPYSGIWRGLGSSWPSQAPKTPYCPYHDIEKTSHEIEHLHQEVSKQPLLRQNPKMFFLSASTPLTLTHALNRQNMSKEWWDVPDRSALHQLASSELP